MIFAIIVIILYRHHQLQTSINNIIHIELFIRNDLWSWFYDHNHKFWFYFKI